MTPMSELDTLMPAPLELTIAGEMLQLTPLRVGQLPAFLRNVEPIVRELASPSIDWLSLFGTHGDAVLNAIAIATGKPRDWLDGLTTDAAIELAARVIEVNADFFIRAVLPRIEAVTAQISKLEAQASQAGSTSSSS